MSGTALLADQVAVVTGGGSGIGRACAVALAERGAGVAVVDRNYARATETIGYLPKDVGGRSIAIECDVADEESVAGMVREVVSTLGRLDIAHNCAGIGLGTGNTVECPKDKWDTIVAVNMTGLWLCMKYQIPAMIAGGGGAIVNMSSGAGLHPVKNQPAYVASKHGVIGITKAAALEFAAERVRINAICPGSVLTRMTEAALRGGTFTREAMESVAPMGRLGQATEIAEAATWLCSDGASFVTGAVLPVDGGAVAGLLNMDR